MPHRLVVSRWISCTVNARDPSTQFEILFCANTTRAKHAETHMQVARTTEAHQRSHHLFVWNTDDSGSAFLCVTVDRLMVQQSVVWRGGTSGGGGGGGLKTCNENCSKEMTFGELPLARRSEHCAGIFVYVVLFAQTPGARIFASTLEKYLYTRVLLETVQFTIPDNQTPGANWL